MEAWTKYGLWTREIEAFFVEEIFFELKKKKKEEGNMGHSRKKEPCDGRDLESGRNSSLWGAFRTPAWQEQFIALIYELLDQVEPS